jgi:hypothetical protein
MVCIREPVTAKFWSQRMPDTPVVHIGENSPEQVAFKLLETIANIERISISSV